MDDPVLQRHLAELEALSLITKNERDSIKSWQQLCARSWDDTLEIDDTQNEIKVVDAITFLPLNKNDTVRASDKHCYSRSNIRENVRQTKRPLLPLSTKPMTAADQRLFLTENGYDEDYEYWVTGGAFKRFRLDYITKIARDKNDKKRQKLIERYMKEALEKASVEQRADLGEKIAMWLLQRKEGGVYWIAEVIMWLMIAAGDERAVPMFYGEVLQILKGREKEKMKNEDVLEALMGNGKNVALKLYTEEKRRDDPWLLARLFNFLVNIGVEHGSAEDKIRRLVASPNRTVQIQAINQEAEKYK